LLTLKRSSKPPCPTSVAFGEIGCQEEAKGTNLTNTHHCAVLPSRGGRSGRGALGFTTATVARIALLLDLVGDAALTAISAVEEPMLAPVAALGMLAGMVGAARMPGGVADTAKGQSNACF